MKIFLLLFVLLFSAVNSFSAVRTWDGGGGNGNWTTAANWVGDAAPVYGDDLVFPAMSAQFAANNDFSTTFFSFASLTIEGGDYTIGGNDLRLTNGLIVNGGTQLINTPIQIIPEPFSSSSQTFRTAQGSTVTLLGLFIASGFTGPTILTLDGGGSFGIGVIFGSGSLTKTGSGTSLIAAGSYGGAITLNDGVLVVNANIPDSTVTINAGTFGGTGTVGPVTATGGIIAPGNSAGELFSNGNVTMGANSALEIEIGGIIPATQFDRLTVNGTLSLAGTTLRGRLINGFVPPTGQKFAISTTGGAITGQFAQGTNVNIGGFNFTIAYDTNSIVLTATGAGTPTPTPTPTPSFVTVSGRVTTPSSLGLRNAVVALTDSQGVRRTATTSSFGFYSFDGVVTGQTYVIRVSSRRYRFAARNLPVNDNLTNVDFVGLE